MKVVDLPSDFFNTRRGSPIRYVVLHSTEGTDSRLWLTKTGRVSANYLVQGDTAYRLVPEDLAAWHAGRIVGTPTTPHYTGAWEDIYEDGVLLGGGWTVNPNNESIGIEVEGFADQDLDPLSIRTTSELIWDIRERRGPLPLVSHSELSPGDRRDPGVRNRAAIEALLAQEDDMTPEQDTRLKNVESKLDDLMNQQSAFATNVPRIWLQRLFYGLNPFTGKRRRVDEAVPAELVVPD